MAADAPKEIVPRVIHYCWMSGDPFPAKIRECVDSWRRVMPDYELKLWSKDNFDVDSVPFVREAVEARKWAFAADYIRMYALYIEGGIYLDSDVRALKRFDDFLGHGFFSSLEHHPTLMDERGSWDLIDKEGRRTTDEYIAGMQIQAAVMGAAPGHPFVRDVLDFYKDRHFINADGTYATDPIAPLIYARVAEPYGFRYVDRDRKLKDDMMIYRSEIFAGNRREMTADSYAVHLCAHSWHATPAEKLRAFCRRLLKK